MPRCPNCHTELTPGVSDCARCATLIDSVDQHDRPTLANSDLQTRAPAGTPTRPTGPRRIAHFEIRRELGAGGMGTVYLAHDERMHRDVALKVLSRHLSPEKAGKRFEQEAWIAGRLDHPNIVKVYDRGQWDELSYFAMELVEGGSLSDVIENMKRSGRDQGLGLEFGTSPYIHWALRTVIEAARGLDFAHRQGIVHRDIKPVNMLLNRSLGAVKIADFGIAVDLEATRMTTDGRVMGTVLYMSPEQIRGDMRQINARTDVYSLGVTLFEMMTLQMPYSGKTQQLYMSQVLTGETLQARRINARVSQDLDTVLRKSMEKDPADRYQTAGAFADDLENVLHLRPIAARPVGPLIRTAKWIRRRPVHAALIATLVVGLPVAGWVGLREMTRHVAARHTRVVQLLDEARWLGQREEYALMLDRATAVLAIEPGNVMALRHRAMALFRLGDLRSSNAQSVTTQREQAISDIEAVIKAVPAAAWPHTLKAWMLGRLGRQQEAVAEASLAASLRPQPPSDEDVTEEARLATLRGDHRLAIDLYTEFIRRYPDSSRAISARAQAYEALGRRDDALIDNRVAVGLDPRNNLALIDIARLSVNSGRLDDAEAYVSRALAIDPENPFALETRGELLVKLGLEAKSRGDLLEARRLLVEAQTATQAALDRSDALVWGRLNLATAIAEQAKVTGDADPNLMGQAIGMYQGVLDRFPEIPASGQQRDVYVAAQVNLCDGQIALRRLQEAVVTCSGITRISPDDPDGFYNLAGAHSLLGHREEALAALANDLKLGDHDWEYLQADPWFANLRADPRFTSIIAEMKRAGEQGVNTGAGGRD